MELKSAVAAYLKLCPQDDCSDASHGPIGEWDVSRVTDMSEIFMDANMHIHTCKYTCTHAHMHITHMHYTCACAHTFHINAHTHAHTCTHTYIHTYTHAYMHTYVHTMY